MRRKWTFAHYELEAITLFKQVALLQKEIPQPTLANYVCGRTRQIIVAE